MEEEGGDDSEMIDAMDGWDSEDDTNAGTGTATPGGEDSGTGSDGAGKKKGDDKKGADAS